MPRKPETDLSPRRDEHLVQAATPNCRGEVKSAQALMPPLPSQLLDPVDDLGIGERGHVARILAIGDCREYAAHDLA